ncbi:molybdate ABC transporter substrate-binding protein [Sulfurimonas crateris]|uniref:Molybdate ABC transporter substrate-binding protein n=1 Tax=Sulfurimonas crateris TaxID=2574727 RepID=A0A4U2Z836_9BACT|nr:molybdate ABC transporter substrate-binding protein [Sulfurimonas crateris]TKI70214.1 molybdate ABC transporter substrate-binding protein [Sulfurimonas crateris]
MKKIILSLMVLSMSLFAGTINVAVAANVSYAMDTLLEEFHKTNPDTQVKVTLGSSGKLTAQIKNGAPYQLFMAANMMFPQNLYEEGTAITVPVVYAQGSLAMLSNSQKDFSKSINLLKDQSIQKIAIANPKTAPYGKAALEAIKNAGVLADVEGKFVYAESISQTVSYAVTAADIGFIAKSSLYSPKMTQYKEGVHWVDVDSKLYTPIDQGIVIIKNAKDNSDAKAFYDFMLSAQAKKILIDFGYMVP